MEKEKIKYVEPSDYFPKAIRRKYKLGEYADLDKKEINNNSTNKEK